MLGLRVLGLIALIFAQYLTTAIPAYLLLLLSLVSGTTVKLPTRFALYLCAVCCYWLAVVAHATGKNVFVHMLFYFGFFMPLVAIFSEKRIAIEAIINERNIIGICGLTIIEAILFNSPIGQHLYWFPQEGTIDRTAMFGFYQRPMGIAGNASMTSSVLFFLVVLTEHIRGHLKVSVRVLIVLTAILLASGTAFGLLMLYALIQGLRLRRFSRANIAGALVFTLILAIGMGVAFGYFGTLESYSKFSIQYFQLMYEYKLYGAETLVSHINPNTALLGKQIAQQVVTTTGDGGFLSVPATIGFLGAGLLFIAPLLHPGGVQKTIVPTVFFYISFVHYPGLLTPPGQVLVACFLLLLARNLRAKTRSDNTTPL